jgi:hypothetical protein
MPGGGTFGDPIGEGLYLLDHSEAEPRARDARDSFEAAFLRECPDDVSPETWLARLHACAAEGLWDDKEMVRLREKADALAQKAYTEVLTTPVDPEVRDELGPDWGSDDDGNWFTENAAIKATQAGQMYTDLADSWNSIAEYWERLQEEFEADPDEFVAQILDGDYL